MRILVTGSRYWKNYEKIYDVLSWFKDIFGLCVIIEGACRGADTMAANAGKSLGHIIESYPAEWEKYGKSAGHIRNQEMLDKGKPHFVLVFHPDLKKFRGTADMVRRAQKVGLMTMHFKR